jgi:hypothetical protein
MNNKMKPNGHFLFPLLISAVALSSCANPHFFPGSKPLFPGLDDQAISQSNHEALSQAKTDFMQVQHSTTPTYAKLVSADPYSRSKTYQGKGYTITLVDKYVSTNHTTGPSITLSPSITGGKPYHYDEVDATY